jgi:hypothetical protein
MLRYLNAKVSITADSIVAVGPGKSVTRIKFDDIVSVKLQTVGQNGPLAVVRSARAKITVQKGINDWTELRDALELLGANL